MIKHEKQTSSLKGKKILLVDDEKDILDCLTDIFEPLGCILYTAHHGKRALEIIKSNHIDLIISDVKMPIINGLSVLRSLDTLTNAPPLILITGVANISMGDAYRAEMIFSKPFDEEKLIGAAKAALERKKKV